MAYVTLEVLILQLNVTQASQFAKQLAYKHSVSIIHTSVAFVSEIFDSVIFNLHSSLHHRGVIFVVLHINTYICLNMKAINMKMHVMLKRMMHKHVSIRSLQRWDKCYLTCFNMWFYLFLHGDRESCVLPQW